MDQQDTDKYIDEGIVDVTTEDNKEDKLHDEPELVCKETNRRGNPK